MLGTPREAGMGWRFDPCRVRPATTAARGADDAFDRLPCGCWLHRNRIGRRHRPCGAARYHGALLAWAAFLAASGGFSSPPACAADATPPSTPVVTDDGAYTTSTTTLHATWVSADAESGIAAYQYLIRRDSTSGTIVVTWTSTGTTPSVTRTGLTLIQGTSYYVGVKALNGDGLWSAVGSSNGIRVDTTPPSAPGRPTEGSSTTDVDVDGDGAYTVYWAAPQEPESGIAAYEVQERVGTTGAWTTLTSSRTSRSFSVSGRLHNTQYFYQVRARNGAGLWGAFSPVSDGVLVDRTGPSVVTVTDDGATTTSTTTLHATWTAASDPESGLLQYEYLIRRDSTAGTILVTWTPVGLATEVTRTGLSLVSGTRYYLGVRAKNNAGLYSALAYSDGITVSATDTTPPTGTVTISGGAAYATSPSVTLTLSATDNSGTVSQMQFSHDGASYSAAEAYAPTKAWTLTGGDGSKTVSAKFRDAAGNWSAAASDTIVLDTSAPMVTIGSPRDGEVLGAGGSEE